MTPMQSEAVQAGVRGAAHARHATDDGAATSERAATGERGQAATGQAAAGLAATALAADSYMAADGAQTVPIAIAHPIANLVIGTLRPATVLAAHSAAVVLCVEPMPGLDIDRVDGSAPGSSAPGSAGAGSTGAAGLNPGSTIGVARIVTLLAREASGVPNGARTALRAADRPFAGINAGDAAFVGAGGIRLPDRYFHAVRTIRTGVPYIAPAPDAAEIIANTAAAALRGVADEPVDELREALDIGDASRLRAAVHALVGLGTGSTPGGDDVLAGTMAGLKSIRRDIRAEQIAAAALPNIDTRTPLMSADLLRLAAAGHVCAEAGAVLRAAAGSAADLQHALVGLLRIGHTSGADLATGIAIGLGAAAGLEPRRPRHTRRGSTDPEATTRDAAAAGAR